MTLDDVDRFCRKNRVDAITIWKTQSGMWQGNSCNPDGSWRVMYGETPGEALQCVIGSYVEFPADVLYEGAPKNLVPNKRLRRNDDIL